MDSAPSVGVDVGGTFTDVVLLADGDVTTAKVPTTADQSEGVVVGIERACESAGVEPGEIDTFRHAMTVATNALLEGEGARTALVTTEGFGDVLAIGRQQRPALYDLSARKPEPLVPPSRRYEVAERASETEIEIEVDEAELEAVCTELDEGTESVAISFLHAYARPENERKAAAIVREQTDCHVVASHEILPEFREYERTATTVADAYVTPIIRAYLGRLGERAETLGIASPQVMQSSGGIAGTGRIRDHAVTTALSGPAAGVVGASLFESSTHEGIITFDMGGTSTDVGLVREGDIERRTDGTVGGYPIHVPMVAVETIGAGGGSIAVRSVSGQNRPVRIPAPPATGWAERTRQSPMRVSCSATSAGRSAVISNWRRRQRRRCSSISPGRQISVIQSRRHVASTASRPSGWGRRSGT
jgi:N-methylhydantoinase A